MEERDLAELAFALKSLNLRIEELQTVGSSSSPTSDENYDSVVAELRQLRREREEISERLAAARSALQATFARVREYYAEVKRKRAEEEQHDAMEVEDEGSKRSRSTREQSDDERVSE